MEFCVWLCVCVCVSECVWGQTVTCVHATLPTLRMARSAGELATNIQSHQRNYVRQQSLYIPRKVSRWSVLYSEISTMNVAVVKIEAAPGGEGWETNGENNIWQSFVQWCPLMDLRWRINPLIEVTFSLNTVSSGYFKHIFPSLNLPSTLRMSSALHVVKWDYERLDRIWAVLVSIPIGGCNPTPTPFCPASLSDGRHV